MNLNKVSLPVNGKRQKKRKGKGVGTGNGKTAGRGHKGQHARSGFTSPAWFEGGQMPLQRRLPKRGFTNFTRISFQVVNVADLEQMQDTEITGESLRKVGLIKNAKRRVKVLGDGALSKAVTVTLHAVSKSARDKIEKAGGAIKLIENGK